MPDYAKVRDDVIVLVGEAAKAGSKEVNQFNEFIAKSGIACPPDWVEKIAHELDRQGLGRGEFSPFNVRFYPNGACIAAADNIRSSRTWRGKLRAVSRSDWIALAAFAFSIFAVFKGN